MARSIPVRMSNGRFWQRKGDAVQHFKEMLGRYSVGARVFSDADHGDLLTLIHIYDSVLPAGTEGKAGNGVAFFEKGVDLEYPGKTQCFFVVRLDGSRLNFSYLRAIDVAARLTEV